MKALILAAGQGTRIRSTHGQHPTCLITFNNTDWTILDQQIYALSRAGIREIGIAVGYESDQIVRHVIKNWGWPHRFKFIENQHYAETNNIYSVWLARDWLKGSSFVVLNANVAFDSAILPPALASTAPITMVVDRAWRDETMKLGIRGNRITKISNQITHEDLSATYAGITVFRAGIVDRFLQEIDDLIYQGQKNLFFSVGVQQLADDGVRISYTETGGRPWAEIADAGDLAFARLYVFPKLITPEVAA
jgi:L-glutamine-phosphate cytidylyltransferase